MATSNETKKATANLQAEVQKRQSAKAVMCKKFMEEELVEVSGSPFYRPYFGDNMPIQINGIAVYVPLDGRPYKIPASFANVFLERIQRVDAQNKKLDIMGTIINDEYIGDNDVLGLDF